MNVLVTICRVLAVVAGTVILAACATLFAAVAVDAARNTIRGHRPFTLPHERDDLAWRRMQHRHPSHRDGRAG
ncbi:MAG: hypothetical protein JST64_13550 [Actinobacteria bacterium]|nr:hypothetical protein [Actinomycetota bacterium]